MRACTNEQACCCCCCCCCVFRPLSRTHNRTDGRTDTLAHRFVIRMARMALAARHDIRSLALGSDNLRGRAGPEKPTSVRAFHVASVVHVASRALPFLDSQHRPSSRRTRNARSPHVVQSLRRISHNKYACSPYCGVVHRTPRA